MTSKECYKTIIFDLITDIADKSDLEFYSLVVREMEIAGTEIIEYNLQYELFKRRRNISKMIRNQPKPRFRVPKENNEIGEMGSGFRMVDKVLEKHTRGGYSDTARAKNPLTKGTNYFEVELINMELMAYG